MERGHVGDGRRLAAAYARPRAKRSRKVAVAILLRVFRTRVRVPAKRLDRFEPCNGCRYESPPRRADIESERASVTFPAAASAARRPADASDALALPVNQITS
jgi:hypothetical protein